MLPVEDQSLERFKSLNLGHGFQLPCLVESLFLSLGTVGAADDGDFSPKSVFGLSHANVISMLLCLVSLLLGLEFILLSLHFRFFGQGFKLVSLLQLLPQSCNLLFGRNQLPFNLNDQFPLALSLGLSPLQGSLSTFL